MNDAAVRAIHVTLEMIDRRVGILEQKVEFLKGQVKARLREEAEDRRHYGV